MKTETTKKAAEAIFNSFDGIVPAALPPFFYSRLLARMQREKDETVATIFLLRPAFLTISLSLVLVLNVLFLVQPAGKSGPSTVSAGKTGIESFAKAYNLGTTAVYE